MNPLILFDYVYYRIAVFYDKRFDYGESKELSATLMLSLLQTISLFTLPDLLGIKIILVNKPNIFVLIGVLVLLFILNYNRYIRLMKFNKFEKLWGEEKPIVRHSRGVLIIVYFFLSFYLAAPR
jgi:uncharacterized membrane protein